MAVFARFLDGLSSNSLFGVKDVFAWHDSVIGMTFL
jgi:hypothetical protein